MTKDDILYNTLKENGFEQFVNKGSGFWETITEAMQKYNREQLLAFANHLFEGHDIDIEKKIVDDYLNGR